MTEFFGDLIDDDEPEAKRARANIDGEAINMVETRKVHWADAEDEEFGKGGANKTNHKVLRLFPKQNPKAKGTTSHHHKW